MELLVTYPAGSTAETSTVVAVTPLSEGVLFAVERTPCHPESPRWPDQPSDRCTVEVEQPDPSAHPPTPRPVEMPPAGVEMPPAGVPVECFEGYLLGEELGLHDPAPEAIACVVHRAPSELSIAAGDRVSLRVDERYREAVSRSHSRCHLVSLALNAALTEAWRKEPPACDSLGNPDFDKLAIISSKIDEQGSIDCYRVGKHLRKTGFSAEALSDPEALAGAVTRIAQRWLQSSLDISITPGKCPLQERRTWSCTLPEGEARFPCGGTHPSRIGAGEGVAVTISWDPGERRLQMRAKGGPLDV